MITEEDHRSLVAKYRNMTIEDIKESLKPGRHNFSLLIDNSTRNFAAGTLVRSFNNFSGQKIIFWHSKNFDRRSSIGTYQVEQIEVARNINQFQEIIKDSKIQRLVALENNIDKPLQYLHRYKFDPNIHYCFLVGAEHGIDQELLDICDDFVEIKNWGSTKSLNLGAAGTVLMNTYCTQIDP